MEYIACPISGATEFETLCQIPDRFAVEKGDLWRVVKSRQSGLTLLNPRPTQSEIGAYYDALVYDPFITLKQHPTLQDRVYKFVRQYISLGFKAREVLKRVTFDSERVYQVLEIGCATGDFLLELKKRTDAELELTGIEIAEKAARFAREENNLRVFQGELLTVELSTPQDLIVMWHTLEHVHRINETLEKLRHLLKPNSMLMVAMPNLDSYDAKHYGKYWVPLEAPRHLYHFTPKTFAALLQKHGLAIVDMHGLPLDSYYNALLSEQLIAAVKKKPSGLGTLVNTALYGTLAAIAGQDPMQASSIAYYIKKI